MFLEKAKNYEIKLFHNNCKPINNIEIVADNNAFLGYSAKILSEFHDGFTLKPNESVTLDFGTHIVGYLHYEASHIDRIQDAPLKLRFTFGETLRELVEPQKYDGELSSSWIQTDEYSMPFLPSEKTLDRRYAFRFLKIERLDEIPNSVSVNNLYCDSVTSADISKLKVLDIDDEMLKVIDTKAAKTLMECEQMVFEDGPKRDRRLWIGDLRLQTLADYMSFNNLDLIKKCLYLFAGHRINDKIVAPCIFENTPPYIDGWYFRDYSLFFISTLYDYMLYGDDDRELIRELYPVAYEQMLVVKQCINIDSKTVSGTFFIDWCPGLDSNIAKFGIYLYTAKQLKKISEYLAEDTAEIDEEIDKITNVLLSLYDDKKKQFVDVNGQESWASQIWGVLSGVLDNDVASEVLKETELIDPEYKMGTPYMISYYLEALDSVNNSDKMIEVLKKYWGEMLSTGLDCFPEYLITAPKRSQFYNDITNSYCHAWSATPTYFIRKLYRK